MSRRRAKVKVLPTILLAVAVFIGVLAASILIQLYSTSDFKGFSKEKVPDPVVTYLDSENAASAGKEGVAVFDWQDHPVFIIGDSLTQGAQKDIEKTIENTTIDSKTGRGMSAAVQILRDWKDTGALTDDAIIVVCLAHNITNTTVADAQKVVDMIESGQSLIMMTGHGNRNMAPANEFIRNLPNVYTFVTVADWDLTIAQSPGLLSSDGIHIAKGQGNQLYAELILRALEVAQPKP